MTRTPHGVHHGEVLAGPGHVPLLEAEQAPAAARERVARREFDGGVVAGGPPLRVVLRLRRHEVRPGPLERVGAGELDPLPRRGECLRAVATGQSLEPGHEQVGLAGPRIALERLLQIDERQRDA